MRALCRVLPIALLLLALLAVPTLAGEGEGAAPKKVKPDKAAPPPKKAPPKKGAPESRTPEDIRKDIEELIRRRGKLPKGWRPSGMGPGPTEFGPPPVIATDGAYGRALARLVLAYLRVADDPAKGPIYRSVLRRLATQTLADEKQRPLFRQHPPGTELIEGLRRDPKTAPVWRELHEALHGLRRPSGPATGPQPAPAAPRAPKPPFEGPFAGAPRKLGGAPIGYVIHAGNPGVAFVTVGPVPKDSTAHAAGLRQGDRIVRIDGNPVDAAGIKKAAKAFSEGGQLTLALVRRDDKQETLSLLLEKE